MTRRKEVAEKNSKRQLFTAKTTMINFSSAGRANSTTGQNVLAPVCVWLTRVAQIITAIRIDL